MLSDQGSIMNPSALEMNNVPIDDILQSKSDNIRQTSGLNIMRDDIPITINT